MHVLIILQHYYSPFLNLCLIEHLITVEWHMVLLNGEICSLIATLAAKDNPSSDTLLSDNLSNRQDMFVEGQRVCF